MTRSAAFRILLTPNNTATNQTQPSAPPPEAVALESDFVVILAALLCALICMVGLIAVARCAWLRRGSQPNTSTSPNPANKGLKKKILQTLPKFTYTKTTTDQKTQYSSECAICLGEFAEGDQIRVLPQCGHCFHLGCVDTWLGSHSSCPSCRQILVVARCQKCGQFPGVGGSGEGEGGIKGGEDTCSSNYPVFLP